MGRRVVSAAVVFCFGVLLLPYTVSASTTAPPTTNTTDNENATTATAAPTTTSVTTSVPSTSSSSTSLQPTQTPTTTSQEPCNDSDSGVGRGIGIGIGIMLAIVAVVVAVLIVVLWRRGWVLPCGTGPATKPVSSPAPVKSAAVPKVHRKPEKGPSQSAAPSAQAGAGSNYTSLDPEDQTHWTPRTYEALQNTENSEMYEDPDKDPAHGTQQQQQAKKHDAQAATQRGQPEGGNSTELRDSDDRQETYENCEPPPRPAKRGQGQGHTTAADNSQSKGKPDLTASTVSQSDDVYIYVDDKDEAPDDVYENTELNTS